MRKNYLWIWAFIMLIVSSATVQAEDIELFDPTTMGVGDSELICIAIAGTEANAPTILTREGLGNQVALKGTTYTTPTSGSAATVWVITREDDRANQVTASRVVPRYSFKALAGDWCIDEQVRNRQIKDYSHDWCDFEINKNETATAYSVGHAYTNSSQWGCHDRCWKFNSGSNAATTTQHYMTEGSFNEEAFGEAHNYDFYFIKFTLNASADEIAAYQTAYDAAVQSQAELLSLDSNLDNLKASSTTDYGKFDASKIDLLKSLGTAYTRDMYTEANSAVEVANAVTLMNALANLRTQFYRNTLNLTRGWYRLKAKSNNTYLSHLDGTTKFADTSKKKDGSQYFYLNGSGANVNTRMALYPFDNLKRANEAKVVGCYGNADHFQINDCGEKGLFMVSGGSNSNKWVGLNEDGTLKYETNTAHSMANLLFFELEALDADETAAVTLNNGDYTISFNGAAIPGTYSVNNGKVKVADVEYALVSYGDLSYSIGDVLTTTLTSTLVARDFYMNGASVIHALPFPGFRFTPVVEEDEINVSGLTNFTAGDLTGKTVKITGTVDFANLEAAGAEDMVLVDNQPFHAYSDATLSSSISYVRNFNENVSGVYSTAAAPKWETICLPFDVETVEGECPVVYSGGANSWAGGPRVLAADEDYWLYELTATGFERNTTGIEANKPYIIAFPYAWVAGDASQSYAPRLNVSGVVTFSGTAIAATSEEKTDGVDFHMVTNFKNVAAGEEVYVLDADGAYFEKGTADANPFRPYVVVPAGDGATPNRIYINNEEPTSLGKVSVADNSVIVISVPGGVSITSEEAHVVTLCTLGGAVLGRVNVQAGTQVITLPVGAFIVDGVKVIVTE